MEITTAAIEAGADWKYGPAAWPCPMVGVVRREGVAAKKEGEKDPYGVQWDQ